MKLRKYERDLIVASRFMAAAAVVGSIAGALLMFILGFTNILQAYGAWLPATPVTEESIPPSAAAMIRVIEALDRFLIGMVLLYFGYGVYSLFIHPERAEEELALPAWLRVKQVGQLKQVVAEVIIVVLFVLFLRAALQVFQSPDHSMTWLDLSVFLSLPLAIALLALALRLLELHPKPVRTVKPTEGEEPGASGKERYADAETTVD